MATNYWVGKRFTKESDVPYFPFPIIPYNHPDLEFIKEVYLNRGSAVGISYGEKNG